VGDHIMSGFKITQPKTAYVALVSNASSAGTAATADIEVLDEGGSLTSAVASLDFAGAGVTATASGDAITVTIPGASSLTVDEIDGSPSVAATEIEVPNGSLSVAGTIATLAYVTPANGGLETITAHGNTGSTETFFAAAEGNVHTATLNANCTFTFAGVTSGKACSFSMLLTQDGTGSRLVTWPGSVVWPGGSAPVLSTAAAAVDVLTFFTLDGGTIWYGFPTGGGGSTSPLTTKGDLYTYSSVAARLPVGTNGQVVVADSAQTTGNKWATAAGDVSGPYTALVVSTTAVQNAGRWEVLMTDGITSPPEPVWSDDGTDWLYGWVAA
jgi:hypothetical protein